MVHQTRTMDEAGGCHGHVLMPVYPANAKDTGMSTCPWHRRSQSYFRTAGSNRLQFNKCVCLVIFGALFSLVAQAAPTTAPTTLPKTPQGAFDVYEWVIFVCDPNQSQTNDGTMFLSTLPDFMNGRRNPAPIEKANEPSPIGVIRISGNSGGDKVDVLLENKGRFLSHWPKAQTRSNGLLWGNLIFSEEQAADLSKDPLGASSWINQLRAPASSSLLHDGRGEKFLLYDAEPSYKLPFRVSAGAAELQYQLLNNGNVPLKDLTLYKKLDSGWQTAGLVELPPLKPTTKPATQPATKSTIAATQPSTQPTTAMATSAPASRPSTSASSQPTTRAVGYPLALAPAGAADEMALLAPWKEKLAAAGPAADGLRSHPANSLEARAGFTPPDCNLSTRCGGDGSVDESRSGPVAAKDDSCRTHHRQRNRPGHRDGD